MKKFLSILLVLTMLIGLFSMVGALAADTAGQDMIVINQIYSGGNNSGATYNHDFIELHNPSDSPVSLQGLSIQKAAKTGTSWENFDFTSSHTIPAKGFFLLQCNGGSSNGIALPTPDATSNSINFGGEFKVALIKSANKFTNGEAGEANATGVIDFVGAGSANKFETAAAAKIPNNTQSLIRTDGIDTNDNSNDFKLVAANPRNSSGDSGNQGGGSQEPQYTAGTLPTSTNNHYVIWDKTNMKAMSTKYNGYYNMSTTVTLDGTTLKGWGYDDVWEIVKNSDNTYSLLNDEGKKVGMGESFNSHPLDGVNDKWELLTDGTSFYLKNVGRTDNTYYISYSSQHGTWSASTSPVALQITAVTRPEKETLTVKPISDALAAESGDFMVKGVVTFIEMSGSSNYNVYIQDDTGAICVRVAAEGFNLALNNTIIATGTKAYYNGTPQLGSATYEISSGVTVAPAITTISALTKSDICKSVKITGLVVTKIDGDNVTVTDGTNTIKIYKGSYGSETLCVGDTIDFTGVVGYFNYNAGHTTEFNSSKLQLRHNSASELEITPHAPHDYTDAQWHEGENGCYQNCVVCGRPSAESAHVDTATKDHNCDLCGKEDISSCTDAPADGDHNCDHCGEAIANAACSDAANDGDHNCDDCGEPVDSSVCTDKAGDDDHKCDECGKEDVSNHTDDPADGDHDCDECGEKDVTGHADADNNKMCDECNAPLCAGEHTDADNDGDHKCDRCQIDNVTECTDKADDGDHKCDECGKLDVTTCADKAGDGDHKCDDCGKTVASSVCADKAGDGDHKCDECGETVADSACADSATDKDHKCDECGKDEMNDHDWADATTEAPKTCKICGKTEGEKLPAVSAGATITFDDKSKRDEFDAEKQVWSENGITVTNNKGESTNDVADYAKPARFYKNSSLTIAFNGMTTISFTCNRDSDVTNLVAVLTGTDYTVSTNEKVVTVTLKTAANSFSVVLSGGQVRVDAIVINDTTSGDTGNEGGNTGSEGGNTGNEGGNTGNEGGNTGSEGGNTGSEGGNTGSTTPATKPSVQTNPVVGTGYIFGMHQAKKNETLYFTGEMDGYYLAVSNDASKAVTVKMEEVEGGVHLFFEKDGKKTYIDIIPREGSEGKVNVVLTDKPTAVFTYDKDLKTFTAKVVDKTWYLGTYGDYTTISASEVKYITGDNAANVGKTQYIAQMYSVSSGTPSNGDTILSTIVALIFVSAMGIAATVSKKKEF